MAETNEEEEKMAEAVTKEEKEEEEKDGGWGWMCVVGGFFIHVLLVGAERTYGMMFPDIMDKFDNQAAAVAGVGGLCSAFRLGLAPLSSLLSNRFSPRTTVIGGGLVMFAGIMLSAYPPNVVFLFFSWGTMVGVGGALVYTPSFVVLASYFRRRLPMANGLSTSGSGVGLLVLSPLYAALVEQYGYSGAMMVLAALVLNIVNCGALFRPAPVRPAVIFGEGAAMLDESDDQLATREDGAQVDNVEISPMTENDSSDKDTIAKPKKKKKNLDFRLFLNFRFVLYITSIGIMTLACIPLMTFLPARMMEQGYSRAQTSYTFSILGIPDTVGRLLGGALFSLVPWLTKRRRQLFVVIMICVGITLAILPSLESLPSYYVLLIVYGLSFGLSVSLIPTLLADWIRHTDPDRDTASGLGFMTCSRGLGTVIGPVIGGLLKDLTGKYTHTFYFLSMMMFVAVIVYLSLIFLDCFMVSREEKSVVQKSENC